MVAAHSLQLLVPAKLTAPQPLGSWVARERLLARLGSAPEARLTLVVAPAGFGKSTLVAQWLAGAAEAQSLRAAAVGGPEVALPPPAPVAWLTLDEHDQDALRFLAYVAGAVERAAPGALAHALGMLAAPVAPPPYVVLQALLVDLSARPGGLTLVLDDYDRVTAEAIHQAVSYLLRNLPQGCRLVLISRVDPPLPLARLRAERQLSELRAADLRFTEAEAATLLASLSGAAAEAELVALLHRQTEGWALALQLAALAQLEAPAGEPGLAAASRQIAEYLAGEVLARLPAATQATLLALAVPDRFCAPLCAALQGSPDDPLVAESRLDELARANLFMIPLDGERRWYRFHHLFRDLLLRRAHLQLGEQGVRELQLRAAAWLAAEGLMEDAVRHFLAAGDEDAAAEVVERLLLPEMGRDLAAAPPAHWLRMLPEGLVARRPGLALILARLSVYSMDLDDLHARLAHVDALLAAAGGAGAPPWPTFQADLTALRGVLCYWRGRPSATIGHMRAALEQGPTTALAVQGLFQLALSYVGNGAYAEGVRLVEGGLPWAVDRLGDQHALFRHSCLANMHQLAGELAAQERDATRLADEAAARGSGGLWLGYAASSLGLAAYERSDLDAAAAHFAALAARKYQVSYPGHMGGLVGLALVAAARGAFDQAAARVQEALAFADEAGGAFLRHQALGGATRVALARGDVRAAARHAAEIGPDMHLGLSLALEAPRLSQVTALIALGDAASLARADELLDACLAEIEPLHHTRLRVRALATMALLRQAQGRPPQARAALERAVALAAPRGFVRTFLDLGPALTPLLAQLAGAGVAPAYLAPLLRMAERARHPAPEGGQADGAPGPGLPELLTPRETEILALLAQRWSDKEIAERLVIAPNTVRKHTSTLYQKLGVGDRREAVSVALALGLLAPDAAVAALASA